MHICGGQLCLCGDIPQGWNPKVGGIPIPTALVDLQGIETVVAKNAMPRWADARNQRCVAWIGYSWQDSAYALGIAALRNETFQVRNIDPAIVRFNNIIGL